MTAGAILLLLAALAVAVVDWWAVAAGRRRVEYACKPGVMVLLLACALVLQPATGAQRAWFVVALVLGCAGDVFLMLPRNLFIPGLVAFLLGHLAFIAGFLAAGLSPPRFVLGLTVVGIVAAVLVPRILAGVRARQQPVLVPAVVAYMVVISLMVAAAAASRQPLAVVPAALFFASDALIAFNRFVAPRGFMPVTIMVTYHLAQAGLVVSLAL